MKITKRLLAVLVVLVLLCVGVPFAFAEDESSYQVGDHIQFGSYPQTRVEETPKLQAAANNATWKSYGYYYGTGETDDGKMTPGDYMRFADFFCNGVKYRAVFFSSYRPYWTGMRLDDDSIARYTFQDDNGYTPNTIYYFKYEPLTWRVLDPSTGYIMCESIIDAQSFQSVIWRNSSNNECYQGLNSTIFANDYNTSSIKKWLDEWFYETAFTIDQRTNIKNKTNLLSYWGATRTSFGFASSSLSEDLSRKAKGTDYAKCQGLVTSRDGYSSWWLCDSDRTYSNLVFYVASYGTSANACTAEMACEGVRPTCSVRSLLTDDIVSKDLFSFGECVHHEGVLSIENEKLATCSVGSFYDVVKYCTICGTELSRETINEGEPLGHSWQTYTTLSTCSENGYTITVCTRCGETLSSEILSRLEHTWNNGVVTQDPTCATPGVKTYTCTGCGETYTEPVDVLEHTWDEGAVTKEPSCTETGVLTYTCADCSATKTETIGKLDHELVLVPGKAATCEETGLTDGWKCDSCGKVFLEQQTIEALGHDPQVGPVVEPTCTEAGYTPFICTRCGEIIAKTDPTDPLDHEYKAVYVWADNDKTVTASLTCTRCGDVTLTETVEVETEITVKPTCSTEGELTMTAAFTNKVFLAQTKTKVLPIDPDAHVLKVTVTPPTCLDDGYTTHACTLCRYGYSDEIVDALGHDWNDGEVTLAPTCTTTGTMLFTCKRDGCGETMEKKLPANPDMHVLEAVVHAPTCTEEGYTAHLCQNCKYGYTDAHVDALGHNLQHHDAKAPTCQEPGWEAYNTCSRCDYTTLQELAAVDHRDSDNNGLCDFCGEMMQGGDHCKYCGQIHGGAFGWLVKIFHNIFAMFKR